MYFTSNLDGFKLLDVDRVMSAVQVKQCEQVEGGGSRGHRRTGSATPSSPKASQRNQAATDVQDYQVRRPYALCSKHKSSWPPPMIDGEKAPVDLLDSR